MRYGLMWADSDPFPQDTKVEVQLEDEPVEVVPEETECPDCPECPDACVVECKGWVYNSVQEFALLVTGSGGFVTAPATIGMVNNGGKGSSAFVAPVGQFCNHRIRLVVTGVGISDPSNYHATIVYDSALSTKSAIGVIVNLSTGTTSGTITIQPQIDLTDAAPGSETWTDLCGLFTLAPNSGH